jgi:hypothetical protein
MKIRRAIGRRLQRPSGVLAPPSAEEIAWREAMSRTRTRVPKGVFRYASIEEANADRKRWHVELVASDFSSNDSVLIGCTARARQTNLEPLRSEILASGPDESPSFACLCGLCTGPRT